MFLESFKTPKFLLTLAAICGSAAAIISFGNDIAQAADDYLVTEGEFLDFRQQDKLEKIEDDIHILRLQLKHEPEGTSHYDALIDKLTYRQQQQRYLECLFDPRFEENECPK